MILTLNYGTCKSVANGLLLLNTHELPASWLVIITHFSIQKIISGFKIKASIAVFFILLMQSEDN